MLGNSVKLMFDLLPGWIELQALDLSFAGVAVWGMTLWERQPTVFLKDGRGIEFWFNPKDYNVQVSIGTYPGAGFAWFGMEEEGELVLLKPCSLR